VDLNQNNWASRRRQVVEEGSKFMGRRNEELTGKGPSKRVGDSEGDQLPLTARFNNEKRRFSLIEGKKC